MSIRVLIWNEGRHETLNPRVAEIYPEGIHGALAAHLRQDCPDMTIETATLLQDSNHGLNEERLNATDVLLWWGHLAHQEVSDAGVDRVQKRVLEGMGLIVLHSAHFSKIFKRLMGTTCDLKWREYNDREILWVTRPGHPITQGVDDHFILDNEEMYGEYFDIPEPQETLLISSFSGGEVFRSGCTWTRGAGRIFYFRPGHETYPTYHNRNVLKIIANAIRWAKAAQLLQSNVFGNREAGWIDRPKR